MPVRARRAFDLTGRPRPVLWVSAGLVLGGALLGWLAGGAPSEWNLPKLTEVQVEGGGALSPEYLAVLLGLVLYTSAFVAEVVRAGIASVSLGQHEASASLGLVARPFDAPGGVAAGAAGHHPAADQPVPEPDQELVARRGRGLPGAGVDCQYLAQPDRPRMECIAIIMLIYLTTSLLTSALMNWFNSRAAIKER
jgi:general L-amino acid transport system permease protein